MPVVNVDLEVVTLCKALAAKQGASIRQVMKDAIIVYAQQEMSSKTVRLTSKLIITALQEDIAKALRVAIKLAMVEYSHELETSAEQVVINILPKLQKSLEYKPWLDNVESDDVVIDEDHET